MLTLPNFERLRVFHAVYMNLSIQKAADTLFVTRSAVSQSLKILEEEVGVKLFIRNSKAFQATAEGESLFITIDPFIVNLQETFKKFEIGAKRPVGKLRIGAPLDFGSNYLTEIVGKFRKKFPEVTFDLILGIPIKQLEMLCDGKLDLAFIDNGDIHAGKYPVSVQDLMKEEFVLVASPKLFKEFDLNNPTLEKIERVPVVDYLPHAPVMRMWIKHHFLKDPHNLNVVYSAESVRGVLNAVAGDIGIGVVPDLLVKDSYKHFKKIKTSKKHFVNQLIIAHQYGKALTIKEKEFIQFCKQEVRKIGK